MPDDLKVKSPTDYVNETPEGGGHYVQTFIKAGETKSQPVSLKVQREVSVVEEDGVPKLWRMDGEPIVLGDDAPKAKVEDQTIVLDKPAPVDVVLVAHVAKGQKLPKPAPDAVTGQAGGANVATTTATGGDGRGRTHSTRTGLKGVDTGGRQRAARDASS